jgi:glycine oxidase
MVDFIIVGRGLAASVLMHTFYKNNISFITIGTESLSNCSRVAAGIWNPVVIKRMNPSWKAAEVISALMEFYPECERTLQTRLITLRQIVKPFTEEQEKALWKKKAGAELSSFLVDEPQNNLTGLEGLKIPNDFGLIENAGNLDMPTFLSASAAFFKERIRDEVFEHKELVIENSHVEYKYIKAGNVIFCEGHVVSKNPFFSWIPLNPAKGELLTISSEEIHLKNRIFNRDGFLMDLSDNRFRLGATFEWDKLDEKPTAAGLKELTQKLRRMTSKRYTVEDHQAGIRPATVDRRPIVGKHPVHERLFVFNGLGAKGVMLAPYLSGKFVLFFSKKEDLCPEADVRRFYHLYERR